VEVLQRIQPLDFLFVVLWAGIVGWGLQAGLIRHLGMLLGVYVGAIAAATLYKPGGRALALAFGNEGLPRWEFIAYSAVFLVVFGSIGLFIWRVYPLTRLGNQFGADNLLGAMLGAIWGAMLLIMIVTILRYFVATPWRGQETAQQGIFSQVEASQMAPVLQVVLAPLWQIMMPWFPMAVPPR
jgi:uncharacterized membrane protein required for colicin V production